MNKIKFEDLNGWLRTLVILGWVMVGLTVIAILFVD